MSADPYVYCLDQLTDYSQFERLCTDLMAKQGYTNIEPLGGSQDRGRDALDVSRDGDGPSTVFAYSVREDWKVKLRSDCRRIREEKHSCDRVAFLSTEVITATQRDEAKDSIRKEFGWELELYGMERLRTLLSATHPDVAANHPQIFCPPWFPQAGGLPLSPSRDHIILDFHPDDMHFATWLAQRLRISGYNIWSSTTAPIGGSSLDETIQHLIRGRAYRYVPVLSVSAIADADLNARRALASSLDSDLVLPLTMGAVDSASLDRSTREKTLISFETDWAVALGHLLEVLESTGCPRGPERHDVGLRAFVPETLIEHRPETVYSNRFSISNLVERILRYKSSKRFKRGAFDYLRLRWPARRVDEHTFLSLLPPPPELASEAGLRPAGEAAWLEMDRVDGIPTSNLVPELVRKTVEVEYLRRGLEYCQSSRNIYFPENLLPSNRLGYTRLDGRRVHIQPTGRRKHTSKLTPHYRYQLVPVVRVDHYPGPGFCLVLHVRLRITDDKGVPLTGKTINSRRKHLCANWWNNHWLARVLALIQYLTDEDRTIRIGSADARVLEIDSAPHSWEVPVRLREDRLADEKVRLEALLYYAEDDDEEGDEDE